MIFRSLSLCGGLCLFMSSSFLSAGGIKINISVDWEGRNIRRQNLRAMSYFRQDYPEVKMLHFLNPAYYTKPNAKASRVTAKIRSVLLDGDGHGLHIHGWKRLFEASGVKYKSLPSWHSEKPQLNCRYDCGHSVPITTYSYSDLRRVFKFSLNLLEEKGFKRAKSFRAGGWMADKNVLSALVDEGIMYDYSALPAFYLNKSSARFIKSWVKSLWHSTSILTQPYSINLPNERSIYEFPNNGCLADYVTGKQMFKVFLEHVELWKNNPREDLYLSIGFHQETAQHYLYRIRDAINLIKRFSKNNQIPVSFIVRPKLEIM